LSFLVLSRIREARLNLRFELSGASAPSVAVWS
jgi:hypothetical protein